jgi:beta-N-acetylhexosaminidase
MSMRLWRAVGIAARLFMVLLVGTVSPTALADESAAAADLFDSMTVAERIGQLFLVTYLGSDTGPESDIAELILDYSIGGLVLLATNDNIGDPESTTTIPAQVAEDINQLQRYAIAGPTLSDDEVASGELEDLGEAASLLEPIRTSVPLFVATTHEGDGYPNNNIRSGLTEIPNNMAIGATWQPENAELIGTVVGSELSAIGVNMLLGPSLDVLENPDPFRPGDLGTRSFGGDPYWVGLMGRAFTTGVHSGSGGRMAVIAKHFPGNGSSDRPVDEEVPTVRKSLEQLKQIELAPFFAVANVNDDAGYLADGLLTTHIRYQGFQGNIRATTNPISFDQQALATLMELPEFSDWRAQGGVIVSDALGVRSVARFYDNTEEEFPHRRIARDALLAGNDLLYLADFALAGSSYENQLANVKDTILWFQEIYETDQPFQQRVDESVRRILQLKLRLYSDDLGLDNVLIGDTQFSPTHGQEEDEISDLARASVTLISPSQDELLERLDSPPGLDESIVIFTDVRTASQCSGCPAEPLIGRTALQDRILALYGPDASEQLSAGQLQSFSLDDLQAFLDAGPDPILPPTVPISPTLAPDLLATPDQESPLPTPVPTPAPLPAYEVQEALRAADWLIFAILGPDRGTATLSDFLAQRADVVHNTKAIVFAYGAPYYLDSTEISKLTAYFGIYSKASPFLDASVRALFQESLLTGASPVDIEGVGYNLFDRTQPDADQVIELFIAAEGQVQSPPSEAPLDAAIGDTLHLLAGPILDNNGNPVPDGTMVQFVQLDRIQGLVTIIEEVTTFSGIAALDYVLEARTGAGQFRITANAGAALVSQEVDISIEDEAQVAIITPTPPPTPTPTPSPTATPTATSTPMPTPSPTTTPIPLAVEPEEPGVRIAISQLQLLLGLFVGLLVIGNLGLSLAARRRVNLVLRLSWPLWGVIGALLAYNYYALRLPGTSSLPDLGPWAGLIATLAGGLLGLISFQFTLWLSAWRRRVDATGTNIRSS